MRVIPDQKKVIPKPFRDIADWQLSRKHFIRSIMVGGVATQLPFKRLIGQVQESNKPILTTDQLSILRSVQDILFPIDDFGPGAEDINADDYLLWVLADPEKDPDETKYIIDGIGWVDETAVEEYSIGFEQLARNDREQLIAFISKTNWGENWLSVILTFIFEALLSDPLYGSNTESIGWKWLDHNPGQPRPTSGLLYPKILNTINKA